MSKAKSHRTVSCGGCGQDGHNKRTCPSKGAPTTATAVAPPPVVTSPEPAPPPAPTPKPVAPTKTYKPPTRVREAPTGDRGTAATAAPYRCPKCNQVAILVIVKVKDYVRSQQTGKEVFKGDQRCEQCLNKPDPTTLILKWGARPGETITEEEANPKS